MSNSPHDFPAPPGGLLKYPKHRVIGLMDDPDSVRQAMGDLIRAGFVEKDIYVLSGPEGAERLDVHGRHHGLMARIYRYLERTNDTTEWLQCHHDYLARGGFGLSVSVDRRTKLDATIILMRHGAHDTAYFAPSHWESMHPPVANLAG
ncbi:MAG: general stress protein [Actinomycetota bacterium]|nr:general stress protein [Actinomycetota bacterium]